MKHIVIDDELCMDCWDTYGIRLEAMVAMEEFAELIQAISKSIRYGSEENKEHLREELADAYICMHEMQLIFGITDAQINRMIAIKQLRTETQLVKDRFQKKHPEIEVDND